MFIYLCDLDTISVILHLRGIKNNYDFIDVVKMNSVFISTGTYLPIFIFKISRNIFHNKSLFIFQYVFIFDIMLPI